MNIRMNKISVVGLAVFVIGHLWSVNSFANPFSKLSAEKQEEIKQLEIRANNGDPDAQFAFGDEYYIVVMSQSVLVETPWGDVYGRRYLCGNEFAQENFMIAAEWYERAAKSNHRSAQLALGNMYHEGKVVENSEDLDKKKDDAKAFFWFKKLADQGDSRAQFNLAHMYIQGWGVQKNMETARNWCQQSADQNYEPAISLLERINKSLENSEK
jgi:TPR repeat protein